MSPAVACQFEAAPREGPLKAMDATVVVSLHSHKATGEVGQSDDQGLLGRSSSQFDLTHITTSQYL